MKIVRNYKHVKPTDDVEIKMTLNPKLNFITISISPCYKFLNNSDIFSSGYSVSLKINNPGRWIDTSPYEEKLYNALIKQFIELKRKQKTVLKKAIELKETYDNIKLPNTFKNILREKKLERIINDL